MEQAFHNGDKVFVEYIPNGAPLQFGEIGAFAVGNECYIKKYHNSYVERYEKAKARYDELAALRKEKQTKAGAIDRFIADLRRREELLTVFDNRLWLTVLDYAEVQRDGALTFHFCDGTQITE